ncbi:MAG: diguanylate cyclase [Acidobacteria bacterium]|nr:diguanylate cyclase [Acidobacteriota bacterium]MBI3657469.1 diguanylate cyclase [Acidobacteriota bacterium]
MKILIAEDDDLSRLILEKAVKKLGHECLSAKDGMEAWELFRQSAVDVIISDWSMPVMNGLEFCALVRGHSGPTYTHFIFLTALGDKAYFLTGMQAGADDYLTKPVDMADLTVRLAAAARVVSLHRRLVEQNTELERVNLRLFEQARRDPLTQLGNRLRLKEDLEILRGHLKRREQPYFAALCDIDRFKLYNDHYGHLAGDEVLRRVANVMANHLRTGETIYRFGGEEFLIILTEQALDPAMVTVDRIRQAVEEMAIPHSAESPLGVVTVSIGVAAFSPDDNKSLEHWLKEADIALYRAKDNGRNCIAIFEPVPKTCLL